MASEAQTHQRHELQDLRRKVSYRFEFAIIASLLSIILACEEDEGAAAPAQRGLSAAQMQGLSKSGSGTSKKTKAQGGSTTAVTPGNKRDISAILTIPNRLKSAELLKSNAWPNFKRIREKIKGARDPFWPDIPELRDQDEIEVDPSSVQRKLVVAVPELVINLKFKGSLTGIATNLAMLEDNAGTGYSVRVGDIIGKAPEYVRVKMITNNKITFEPVLGIPEDESKDSARLLKVLRENEQNEIVGVE